MIGIAARNRWSVPFAIAGVLAGFSWSPADAQAFDDGIHLGIGGYVKVGRWAPVSYRVSGTDEETATAVSVDPAGRTVRYTLAADASQNGQSVFRGLVQVGRIDAAVRLRHGEKAPVEAGDALRPLLKQSAFLIATLGKPGGFKQLEKSAEEEGETDAAGPRSSKLQSSTPAATLREGVHVVELESTEQLPVSALGYDALDVLVISGKYELDDRRSRALRRWVRSGGHLIFCRGSELDVFYQRGHRDEISDRPEASRGAAQPGAAGEIGDEHIAHWLPITVTGQSRLRDLGGIETFAARKTAIIFSGRVKAARILDPAESSHGGGTVLATGLDGPLFVRVAFGFGRITFCGLDFHRAPLLNWPEIGSIARRLIRDAHPGLTATGRRSANRRLAQSGVTDLGTQWNAIQQDFPDARPSTTWATMGWLLFYIVLIGPIDYLLVHRLLRRPRLTWVTFPLMIAAASFLALGDIGTEPQPEPAVNQLEIVDIDATAAGQPVRVHSWLTLFSPQSRKYRLSAAAGDLLTAERSDNTDDPTSPEQISPVLTWSGVTENVFGGMYRTTGVSFDRMQYAVSPSASSLGDLPLKTRSTASLKSTLYHRGTKFVESNLKASSVGELQGTLTQNLGGPIDDWILVYGARIYLPTSAAANTIPHGTPWSLAESDVVASDLRGTLTGIRLRKQKRKESFGTREISEQADYNPQSRDPQHLMRILSFHEAAGGKEYTGLDNHALGGLELTGLLRLQRAVLIGRVRAAGSRLMQHSDDAAAKALEPHQRHTFVRIVLPVRQPSGEESLKYRKISKLPESNPVRAARLAKEKAEREARVKTAREKIKNSKPEPPARAKKPRSTVEGGNAETRARSRLNTTGGPIGRAAGQRFRSVVRT